MHSPAPAQAGAPFNSRFLQFRGQRPPVAGRSLAVAFGATARPGPIPRGVAEASASAMGHVAGH
jgi:hypothetical protein